MGVVAQRFRVGRRVVERELRIGSCGFRSALENLADAGEKAVSAWWQSFLRGGRLQPGDPGRPELSVIDLFSGAGGLMLGVREAALALGHGVCPLAAVDVDASALEVHTANFGTRRAICANVSGLVDFHVSRAGKDARFAYEPEVLDPGVCAHRDAVDLLLAGPPCQGHSNLNNRTRRDDPRNLLYFSAVALAVALRARAVLIENVPAIASARGELLPTAMALLAHAGYAFVAGGVLAADLLGAAQTRRRHFLLACRSAPRSGSFSVREIAGSFEAPPRPLSWAIGDLQRGASRGFPAIMTAVPALSAENRRRIDYLFDNGEYDLPNRRRPECHRNGHTYDAVYGRMRWDRPAPTITTGFLTPGRGRFIHPSERRVINPSEAARIQCFPDGFRFADGREPSRADITKWIGDAVPAVLGYAAALPLIASL